MVTVGDAVALWRDADHLAQRGRWWEELGERVRHSRPVWDGEAASTFAEALAACRRSAHTTADQCGEAGAVLRAHADVVDWANRQEREAGAALAGGDAATADAILEHARGVVRASLDRSTRSILALREQVPEPPSAMDFGGFWWSQHWRGLQSWLTESGTSAWQFSAVRTVLDPVGVYDDAAALGGALVVGLSDPVAFAKEIVDVDTWRTNPSLAMGRAAPDIAIAVTTAGTGTAAAATVRGAKVASAAARSARVASAAGRVGAVGGAAGALRPVTASGVRSLLRTVAQGTSPHVRVVRSEAKLLALRDRLFTGGRPITDRSTYWGDWVRHADGTEIGFRRTSESGGPTIDIRIPGEKTRKVHVDAQS